MGSFAKQLGGKLQEWDEECKLRELQNYAIIVLFGFNRH